eukprot:evm.model.scf_159.6 EVM.evm.TU.scf_159.6   scf_159:37341-40128(+)
MHQQNHHQQEQQQQKQQLQHQLAETALTLPGAQQSPSMTPAQQHRESQAFGDRSETTTPATTGQPVGTKRPRAPSTQKRSHKKKRPNNGSAVGDAQQLQTQRSTEILDKIGSLPGPTLSVQPINNSSSPTLTLALLSGVSGQVDWALNQLSVLSFSHVIPVREQKFCHVVSALVKTVEKGIRGHDPLMDMEAGREAELETKWWWETEPDLFAEDPATERHLMWAVCASNILRNLSTTGDCHPHLLIAPNVHSLVAMAVSWLRQQCFELCPATNELVANILDTLKNIGGQLNLSAHGQTGGAELVMCLARLIAARDRLLRIRSAAAGVLGNLSTNEGNRSFLLTALEDDRVQLVPALADVVQCTASLACQSAELEAAGELGYLDIVSGNPDCWEGAEIEMLSCKLEAEARGAATKACLQLCKMPEEAARLKIAHHSGLLKRLVNIALGCESLLYKNRGGLPNQHPFLLYTHHTLRLAEKDACGVLECIAAHQGTRQALLPFESSIGQVAITNSVLSRPLARVLKCLNEPGAHRNVRSLPETRAPLAGDREQISKQEGFGGVHSGLQVPSVARTGGIHMAGTSRSCQ